MKTRNRPTSFARTAFAKFFKFLPIIGGAGVVRLPAPTGIIVTEGTTTIDISWDAVTGAASYEVNINGGGWGNVGLDTFLGGQDVPYGPGSVSVRAVDGSAVAGYSGSADYSLPYPIPGAPQSLSILTDGLDYEATWAAPVVNAAYVSYYRVRINGGSWINNGTSTTYVSSGTAGSYTIDVDAVNADSVDGADASDTFDLVGPSVGFYGASGDPFYVGTGTSPFYN